MSNAYLNAAWRVDDLTSAQKLVLIRLADRADENGECFPGLDGIARDCCVHRTTVPRSIYALESKGILAVKRGGGRNRSNRYKLLLQPDGRAGSKEPDTERGTEKTVASRTENDSATHINRSESLPQPSDNPKENQSPHESEPDVVPKKGPIPYQKIVEMYHEICCPPLSQVYKLTNARKKEIERRWISLLRELEAWAAYFETVAASSFLTGNVEPTGNRQKPWKASFDWLLKEQNMLKVIEEHYDD